MIRHVETKSVLLIAHSPLNFPEEPQRELSRLHGLGFQDAYYHFSQEQNTLRTSSQMARIFDAEKSGYLRLLLLAECCELASRGFA